jgi:excisionase family DNA binding protein
MELVTVAEVARRLGLTNGRIHQMIGEGEMPAALGRIGAAQVWRWDDVARAMRRSGRVIDHAET